MKPFVEEWASFMDEVLQLPPFPNPVVVRTMKTTFYAGAVAALHAMGQIVGKNKEVTDVHVAQLEALHEEVHEYFKRLKAGLE